MVDHCANVLSGEIWMEICDNGDVIVSMSQCDSVWMSKRTK